VTFTRSVPKSHPVKESRTAATLLVAVCQPETASSGGSSLVSKVAWPLVCGGGDCEVSVVFPWFGVVSELCFARSESEALCETAVELDRHEDDSRNELLSACTGLRVFNVPNPRTAEDPMKAPSAISRCRLE